MRYTEKLSCRGDQSPPGCCSVTLSVAFLVRFSAIQRFKVESALHFAPFCGRNIHFGPLFDDVQFTAHTRAASLKSDFAATMYNKRVRVRWNGKSSCK